MVLIFGDGFQDKRISHLIKNRKNSYFASRKPTKGAEYFPLETETAIDVEYAEI